MEKKKKLIDRLNGKKLGIAVFAGLTAAGSITGAALGSDANSKEARNFDYDAAVQSAYVQKMNSAERKFTFDMTMKQGQGELPKDFDIPAATKEHLQSISGSIMEKIKSDTYDERKDAHDLAIQGGLIGLLGGGIMGGLGGVLAGSSVTETIRTLQDRKRRRRKEQETKKAKIAKKAKLLSLELISNNETGNNDSPKEKKPFSLTLVR